MSDEPLYCTLCGAEDWECGHRPPGFDADADHGPEAYCEVDRCALYAGERCEFCAFYDEGMVPA